MLHHGLEPRMRADDIVVRVGRRQVEAEVVLVAGTFEPIHGRFGVAKAQLEHRDRKRGIVRLRPPADRTIYRREKDGSPTILADRYDGKRFNGPNDIERP